MSVNNTNLIPKEVDEKLRGIGNVNFAFVPNVLTKPVT